MAAAAEPEGTVPDYILRAPAVVSVRDQPPNDCTVEPFTFMVQGTTCRGRIFIPHIDRESNVLKSSEPTRMIVMAHGFCCLQTFEPMNTLVRAFVVAGISCCTFDYRGFGESDTPSSSSWQYIDPIMLLEDWREAIRDISRRYQHASIGLWGTSFSGGHVIQMASEHRSDSPRELSGGVVVQAVVSWVGCMNYDGSRLPTSLSKTRFLWEYARSLLSPKRMLKVCGARGEVCVCDGPVEVAEIAALASSRGDVEWANAAPPSTFLRCMGYAPGKKAPQVDCDVLFIAAGQDIITPPEYIQEAAALAPKSELLMVPEAHHCEIYFLPLLTQVVERTVAFFGAKLP